MTFAWEGFLHVAEALVADLDGKDQDREARCRTAISRAYYAAFHSARDHLRIHLADANVSQKATHDYVRKGFDRRRKGTPQYRSVAAALRRLYADRLKADYEAEWQGQSLVDVARKAVDSGRQTLRNLSIVEGGTNAQEATGTSRASRP